MNDLRKNPFAFPRSQVQDGMMLRDYFAAAALQGILGNANGFDERGIDKQEDAAALAYTYADAMLDEREVQR